MSLRSLTSVLAVCALLATTGCGSSVASWIVHTRDRQGDNAVASGNYADASSAYQLALKVDPHDPHARAGIVDVQVALAQKYFAESKFEDALAAVAIGEKYDPQNVRVVNTRAEIEQARLQRQIVLANYPAYADNIAQLRRSYDGLRTLDAAILDELKKFDYTFDTAHLHAAIRTSYELDKEVTLYTNRLQNFRQLVESGVPAVAEKSEVTPPASLLPLP